MTARSNQVAAATGLPRKMMIGAVLAIVAAGRKNPALPEPFPALDRLEKAVLALQKKHVTAMSRVAGAVAARNEATARAYAALAQYKAAVQMVADADPASATSITVKSGLRTRRESTRRKLYLSAKRGRVACSLVVDVKSVAKRASYEWEISLDGGETWIRVRTTTQTKTTITDLPLGKLVQIRCRPITKIGPGDWIGPITVRVT